MIIRRAVFLLLVSNATFALAVAPTSGRWECQSMGADTDANVSVRGDEVVIYRAMYPARRGEGVSQARLEDQACEGAQGRQARAGARRRSAQLR